MKKLFSTFILIFIAASLFAQDDKTLHFGLKAAPSLAWLRSDTKGYESNGSKFGFSYGLITEFSLSSNYAFATGIDVAYRGGKFKSVTTTTTDTSLTTNSTEASYTLQYIELPLTLKFKTNEIGYLVYYLQAGVSPGINIRSRSDFESTTVFEETGSPAVTSSAEGEDVDIQENINNFNLSMIIGGGIEYTLSGTTVLLVGVQFNNGFMDVFDDDPKVNSNYLALTLGILF
jgi:hypothetical protein